MGKRKGVIPTFAIVVLALAILWILEDTGLLIVKVPWFPVIIAIIAIGWILNFYYYK